MRDKKFVLGLALATLALMAIPMAAGLFEPLMPPPPLSYSLALGQR